MVIVKGKKFICT